VQVIVNEIAFSTICSSDNKSFEEGVEKSGESLHIHLDLQR